jgi:hypothetical protein
VQWVDGRGIVPHHKFPFVHVGVLARPIPTHQTGSSCSTLGCTWPSHSPCHDTSNRALARAKATHVLGAIMQLLRQPASPCKCHGNNPSPIYAALATLSDTCHSWQSNELACLLQIREGTCATLSSRLGPHGCIQSRLLPFKVRQMIGWVPMVSVGSCVHRGAQPTYQTQ